MYGCSFAHVKPGLDVASALVETHSPEESVAVARVKDSAETPRWPLPAALPPPIGIGVQVGEVSLSFFTQNFPARSQIIGAVVVAITK